jgi:tyrosyl-tRNA synthetase
MILQAYDFYELNKNYDCRLQIGGSDQWGNIVNGVELTRRMAVIANHQNKNNEVYGLTTPLLTTSDGKKMGKTANGAVWLDDEMLSPFDYYQYFRNVDDKNVRKLLRLFTDLSLEEISKLEKSDINNQKKQLAFEATKICHGEDEAVKVNEKVTAIFSAKSSDFFDEKEIFGNKKLADIIFEIGAAPSKGEAKRLIKGKGVKINDLTIEDENYVSAENIFNLYIGKKKFFKIKIKNK